MEMACEKQIPGRFARLTHGQPVNSIFFGTLLAGALIIYGNLTFVVNLNNVTHDHHHVFSTEVSGSVMS